MNQSEPYLRYSYRLALTLLVVYALLVLFNAYVDPRGIFLSSNEAVNRFFTFPTRIEKSIRLRNEQYDILVLGSSRVEVGIDPLNKSFSGNSVYNLGLSATNMFELHKIIGYTVEVQNPKMVIVGLDFLMFTSQRELHRDFNDSLFHSKTHYVQLLASYLSSFSVLKESLLTLLYRHQNLVGNINARGYLDKTGTHVNHRELFDQILTQNFLVKRDTYAGYKYSKKREKLFKESIAEILAHDIELKLYISPIHARQEEALRVMGLYEIYEDWKKAMVNIVAETQKSYHKQIRFCDYSGYSLFAAEEIPSDPAIEMQWYWESSHYKKELGDLLINDLLSTTGSGLQDADCQLTPENVNTHLKKIRYRQQKYKQNHAFEVSEVQRLYNETTSVRANNVSKNGNELNH